MTRRWCELNGVTGILRSHEVRQGRKFNVSQDYANSSLYLDGYAVEHNGLCTTVSRRLFDSDVLFSHGFRYSLLPIMLIKEETKQPSCVHSSALPIVMHI